MAAVWAKMLMTRIQPDDHMHIISVCCQSWLALCYTGTDLQYLKKTLRIHDSGKQLSTLLGGTKQAFFLVNSTKCENLVFGRQLDLWKSSKFGWNILNPTKPSLDNSRVFGSCNVLFRGIQISAFHLKVLKSRPYFI